MAWLELAADADHGPIVRVEVCSTPGSAVLACRALLDTGASHSAVDTSRVAEPLALTALSRRRMVLAEHGAVDVDVHDVGLRFPDTDLPTWWGRAHRMRLPRAFDVVVGMDVLHGTRLELEVYADRRLLRWTLLDDRIAPPFDRDRHDG